MPDTPRLKLPLLDAAQAQKHVTHNEALLQLDLLTGIIPVLDRTLSAPPGASDGAVYILAAAGSGAWTGFSASDLALRVDGAWRRVLPSIGMTAAVVNEGGAQVYWSGATWLAIGASRGLVKKAASTTRASTVALANDPDLQFAMLANKTYSIGLQVYFSAPATPGFKYALAGPASPVRVQSERRSRAPAATAFAVAGLLGYLPSTAIAGNATDLGALWIDLVVENGATAGTFVFQWAQNVSDASGAIVRAGSTLDWLQVN